VVLFFRPGLAGPRDPRDSPYTVSGLANGLLPRRNCFIAEQKVYGARNLGLAFRGLGRHVAGLDPAFSFRHLPDANRTLGRCYLLFLDSRRNPLLQNESTLELVDTVRTMELFAVPHSSDHNQLVREAQYFCL